MAILMALMFLRKIGQTPCWVEAWIASSNRTIKYKCSNMFCKITVCLCHCTQWLKMIPVHIDGHLPSRSQHRLDFKRFYVDITAAYRYSMYIYICVCVCIYIYILLHIYLYVCMYIYIHLLFLIYHCTPKSSNAIISSHSTAMNYFIIFMSCMTWVTVPHFCLTYIYIHWLQCLTLTSHRSPIKIFRFQARRCVVQKLSLKSEVESLPDALERSIESIVTGTPKIRRKHDWTQIDRFY